MNITPINNQSFTSRQVKLPTNGVLRCLTGTVSSGKSEKELSDAIDIWTTIKRVFNYKDRDLKNMFDKKDPMGGFILTISAGKYLEMNNPGLNKIKEVLLESKKSGDISSAIDNLVDELGKNINLFI